MNSLRHQNMLASQYPIQRRISIILCFLASLALLLVRSSDAQTNYTSHPDQANSVALTLLPSPVRWVDTRLSGGALVTGESRAFCFWSGPIPSGAKGILGNIVAVNPQSTGNLQMNTINSFPPGSTSLINLLSSQDIANGFSTALDSSGCLYVRATVNVVGGRVDVVIDVYGYYQ